MAPCGKQACSEPQRGGKGSLLADIPMNRKREVKMQCFKKLGELRKERVQVQ